MTPDPALPPDGEPRTVVLIEWVDSAIVADGWEDREDAKEKAERWATSPMRTAGFLVGTGPEHVAVALSFNPNRDDVSLVVGIPRSAIRAMRVWAPDNEVRDDA